jgi:uncharacterized protein YoaH (UPF0181 family)
MSEFTLDSLLDSLSDSTAETQIEKVASETVISVADELKNTLTKEASDASTIGETNMSVETGNAIADSILAMLDGGMNKVASAGDVTSGNNVKVETDEMEAQHAARILQTPREGKTVTEVAKALAARTPGGQDAVVAGQAASTEGNSQASVAAKPSDIEKSAAIKELMADGVNFDDAVELVKQASAEIDAELESLEKVAAVQALIGEGIDFDEAVALVKQASETASEYTDLEKAAAVQELMSEDGVDFDEAVAMVKAAALGK